MKEYQKKIMNECHKEMKKHMEPDEKNEGIQKIFMDLKKNSPTRILDIDNEIS